MAKFLLLLGLAVLFFVVSAVPNKKWWETARFYQIYPRSFKDSDGDGLGDINGITEQLAYLKEIGITATWLSPIFTSPMADFGYDIANFKEIDPIFGTMADFEALLEKAKQVGIKIILDLVPNHSSDECEWFIKSVAGDKTYKDFYVWHPGKIVNGTRQAPTNWISVFRGSMWTWNEERQAYYLHQFLAKQPDLNYRNPDVVETMKDVMRFWLRKGVSGFRVDAVPHVFEVIPEADGNYPDEPRNQFSSDPEDYDYLEHIYTANQPETIDLVYQFRTVLDEVKSELGLTEDLIMMTEAYAPLDVIMQYYGNETMDGAHIPFNFQLISHVTNDSFSDDYVQLITEWLYYMPEERTANWVLGNHDRNRVGSRLGEDRIDMMNILLATLPGCSVTYMGEETGMLDVWISWEDTVDPQGCQSNPQEYERLSRDPCRTPFQWNDDNMAGFTSTNHTWLPVSDNYKRINVKRERGVAQSHLNIFKQLNSVRANYALRYGETEVRSVGPHVIAIKRFYDGYETYVVLINLMDDVEVIDLHWTFTNLSNKLEYVLVTDKSIRRKGDFTSTSSIVLLPKEAAILCTV